MRRRILGDFSIPFLVLLVATLFFRLTDADMEWTALFYSKDHGWFLENLWIVVFLHRYGTIPTLLVSFGAACILGYGFVSERFVKYRKISLLCVLLLSIGSGLIVNLILKDHWGRPRPNQLVAFGGERRFLPVWVKGDCETCHSFPNGDASAGFFFLFPFFIFRRTAPRLAASLLLLGIGYGTLMGVGRMVRGAHFASDVIWSWGIMYITGLTLYYSLRMHKNIWWGEGKRLAPKGGRAGISVVGSLDEFRVSREHGKAFAMKIQSHSDASGDGQDLNVESRRVRQRPS